MVRKIFVTGGHFAPAKAVIDKLIGEGNWEIFYVGREFAMEDNKTPALEWQELGHLNNVRYLNITTGRLQRQFFINVWQSIKSLLKIPVGFGQSFWWLLRYQPDVILSFGSYVAVPVVINAWLLGIPILTHDQTRSLGAANRIISLFANKTLTATEVGIPTRTEVLRIKNYELKGETNRPIVYITGGNQGAHAINMTAQEIMAKLAKKYLIIHQTGDSPYHDFERLEKKRNENYQVKKFLTGEESARALAKSCIVISRAGANTVAEIAYLGRPAILIPLNKEQEENAKVLVACGGAEILAQKNLSGKTLLAMIDKIEQSYSQYLLAAAKVRQFLKPDATEKITAEIWKVL